MKLIHSKEIIPEQSSLAGTEGTTLRWLITDKDGAKHYAMRLFEILPGGSIPVHTHDDMEHEIYILEGEAIMNDGTKITVVKAGDALLVQPGDPHSFKNTLDRPLRFICMIPI